MPDPPVIIGVDPGGTETGVVARRSNVLVAATLVRKESGQDRAAYLAEVLDTVAGVARTTRAVAVAVEDVTAPSGHLGMIDVAGLLRTAEVLGGLLTLPGVIVVDAGGNGSQPLDLYPADLVGPLERVGRGKLRHVRSAWDVAGRGALELRAAAR